MKRFVLWPCLLLLFVLATAGTASADTMVLTDGGSTTFGGVSAGFYEGTRNSSPVNLLCLSYDRVTTVGATWTAFAHPLTADGISNALYGAQANALDKYRRAAWLYDQMILNPGAAADIHGAVWNLFNPGATPDTAGSNEWLMLSQSFLSSPALASFDFSRFLLLTPENRVNGPQEFLTAVPEPATMLLLGTGLAGIGAFVKKRRRASSDSTL